MVFASCSEGIPHGVLSSGKMEDVLVDYHLAEAMAEQMPGNRDENMCLMVESALRKHGVSRAELDSSLVYWCRNSEKFNDIYLNVYKRLDIMAQDVGVEHQEQSMYSNLKTEGDTANVWTMRSHAILLANELVRCRGCLCAVACNFRERQYCRCIAADWRKRAPRGEVCMS